MENNFFSYHFAASSIQSFILDGGRLRDAVGASEIVEVLTGDLLDVAIAGFNFSDADFSRRGGGVLTVTSKDRSELERFRDLWSLTVRHFAPGLPFQQGLGEAEDPVTAIQNAQKLAGTDLNRFLPRMPTVGPLTEREPRTGHPAIDTYRDEYLDAGAKAKRHDDFRFGRRLLGRVTNDPEKWRWPLLLHEDDEETDDSSTNKHPVLPFIGDNHNVAIVHADGNGLGNLVKRIEDVGRSTGNYVALLRDFSKKVTETTQQAAKKATQILTDKAVDDVPPGRPLVLGGDDMSFLVRADLAIDFTTTFLQQFESQSQKAMGILNTKYPALNLPKGMTASAGIVFFKAKQPFAMAFHLAESLCKFVKKTSRERAGSADFPPSALAFHRMTSFSSQEDYSDILLREMTLSGENPLQLTLQPYGVGDSGELPNLKDLVELTKFFGEKTIHSGPVRELLTIIRLNRPEARKKYLRWLENMDPDRNKRAPKGGVLERYMALMKPLLGQNPQKFPAVQLDGRTWSTPLGDVMALLAVRGVES